LDSLIRRQVEELARRDDFGGVVRLIRETMNVGVNLTLHSTSGPPPHEKAKAWIHEDARAV
jgi:hypothetical protein